MTDAQRLLDAHLTEKQFMNMIIEIAYRMGWLVFHDYDSRRNNPGMLDLILSHPKRKVTLFWEAKVGKNRVTQAQAAWIDSLVASGCNARVVRPEDWQYIVETLAAKEAVEVKSLRPFASGGDLHST